MKIQNLIYGLLGTILGTILTGGSIAMESDSSSEGDFLAQAQTFGPMDFQDDKLMHEQISTFKIIGAEESENNLKTHPSATFCINQRTLLKLITEKQGLNSDQLEEIEYFQKHTTYADITPLEGRQKISFPHAMYKVAPLLELYCASLSQIAIILELSEGITWKILNIIKETRNFRLAERRREKKKSYADES